MKIKLLYITFIDMNVPPTSGSSVRPIKMEQAFKGLDIDVKTVSGISNDFKARKKAVKEAIYLIEHWKPDMCYIEPPSGPMFYYGDLMLIKRIHKSNIPISIFYRDAYWRYPDYYIDKKAPRIVKLKHLIVRYMQKRQWKLFNSTIDVIYFPSETMAREFECNKAKVLPPGTFRTDVDIDSRILTDPLSFIFVGGAAVNHGTLMTIESFKIVNQEKIRAKLKYICPKDQWDSLDINEDDYSDWLEVIHASGDELEFYYNASDVALLTAPRTFYRDFAVPIKIYEYISYLKPILVTNCTETAKAVCSNNVGWVVDDNVAAIAEKITSLCNHPEEVMSLKHNLYNARERNLWEVRAKKVVNDLKNRRFSDCMEN